MTTRTYSGRRRLVATTLACLVLIFSGVGVAAHLEVVMPWAGRRPALHP